jgi:hypothetical protein
MRRTIVLSALLLLAVMGVTHAQKATKAVSIQLGQFISSDWKVQNTHPYPGYNLDYLGPSNGMEIIGALSLRNENWRFRLESGYRWHSNGKYFDDYFGEYVIAESKLRVIPIRANISRIITMGFSGSSIYLGGGAGLNIAEIKYIQGMNYAEGIQSTITHKRTKALPEILMLAGLDFPLANRLFIDAEICYSYFSSDWNLERKGSTPIRLENINIGGTSLKIGIERRF